MDFKVGLSEVFRLNSKFLHENSSIGWMYPVSILKDERLKYSNNFQLLWLLPQSCRFGMHSPPDLKQNHDHQRIEERMATGLVDNRMFHHAKPDLSLHLYQVLLQVWQFRSADRQRVSELL